MSNQPEWFALKTYGYGSGLPIAWQGWSVLIGYIAAAAAAAQLARYSLLAFGTAVLTLSLAFVWICSKTTRGGWSWRWGSGD